MQTKTEKQGFFTVIKNFIVSIPYRSMNKYVQSHNNTDHFQTMYSSVWFVALVFMLVLSVVCFRVDFDVLYGIHYNSTQDISASWWHAAECATVIQFLLLICGGLFLKILIFGKLKKASETPRNYLFGFIPTPNIEKRHALQFVVFGSLFLYGLSWTLDLSSKTYFSAKANAIQTKKNIESSYSNKYQALKAEGAEKVEELRKTANKNLRSIEENYNARIANIEAKYKAKKDKRTAKFNKGLISKSTLATYIADYETRAENEKAPLIKEKSEKLAPIQNTLANNIQSIQSYCTSLEKGLDYQESSARSELENEITQVAKETKGRNITYNILNVILLIGLLLFSKSCLDDESPEPSDTEDTDKHTVTEIQSTDEANEGGVSGHSSDPQNTESTVNTDKHSKTQHKVGEEIEFEEIENQPTNTEKEFIKGGHTLKKIDGIIHIKHGKTFANLAKLKIWQRTYEGRVGKYAKEGKVELAFKNSGMVSKIIRKINFLKDNYVTYEATREPTTANKQERPLQSVSSAKDKMSA